VQPFRVLVRVVGVVGLLGIVIVSLVGGGDALPVGSKAPAALGRSVDGGAFDLVSLRGQPVLVNVWATWCAPCVQELPDLAAAARRHKDVRFVGLAIDSPWDDVVQMASRFSLPYPVAAIDRETQTAWKAQAVPVTYLLDGNGVVTWRSLGALQGSEIDAILARQKLVTTATP
jgi:thiol-disulfide isomerase/thioredoxin